MNKIINKIRVQGTAEAGSSGSGLTARASSFAEARVAASKTAASQSNFLKSSYCRKVPGIGGACCTACTPRSPRSGTPPNPKASKNRLMRGPL